MNYRGPNRADILFRDMKLMICNLLNDLIEMLAGGHGGCFFFLVIQRGHSLVYDMIPSQLFFSFLFLFLFLWGGVSYCAVVTNSNSAYRLRYNPLLEEI